MRAIDTNVAARFLLADDPEQATLAIDIMAGSVFVPITVLLELGWLLTSRYRQPRDVVATALLDMVDLPKVTVNDPALVRWALNRFAQGGDFADMLHLIAARDAAGFATFDRAIAAAAGPDSPVAIETL